MRLIPVQDQAISAPSGDDYAKDAADYVEDNFALHISIVATGILKREISIVLVLPKQPTPTGTMCNLYSITTNQVAIAALFRVINQYKDYKRGSYSSEERTCARSHDGDLLMMQMKRRNLLICSGGET